MRALFHTRSTAAVPWTIGLVLVAGACASGGPIYTFQPTDGPLEYTLSTEGTRQTDEKKKEAGKSRNGWDTTGLEKRVKQLEGRIKKGPKKYSGKGRSSMF